MRGFTSSRACLALICCASLCSCFPPRDHATLPAVSPEMVTYAKNQWPESSDAQLNKGHDAMVSSCTACHSMPAPSHETAKDWPGVMKTMAHKAKRSDDDQIAMLHYMLAARETTTAK